MSLLDALCNLDWAGRGAALAQSWSPRWTVVSLNVPAGWSGRDMCRALQRRGIKVTGWSASYIDGAMDVNVSDPEAAYRVFGQ